MELKKVDVTNPVGATGAVLTLEMLQRAKEALMREPTPEEMERERVQYAEFDRLWAEFRATHTAEEIREEAFRMLWVSSQW